MNTKNYDRIISRCNHAETKVISFDVFDTSILRPFLTPTDLFKYIDICIKNTGKTIHSKFSDYRIEAERNLRLSLKEKGDFLDPTLDEIYKKIEEIGEIDNILLQYIKNLETHLEIHLSKENPTVKKIFNEALKSKKRIIFASDSYFNANTIGSILENAGYSGYEKIYTSCDCKATKKNGALYHFIAQDLDINTKEIFHIGDNINSDIREAEKSGVKAILIPKASELALHKDSIHTKMWEYHTKLPLALRSFIAMGINRANTNAEERKIPQKLYHDIEHFGYAALGPIIYIILGWLSQKCKTLGIDHIFFLSRDGY